MTKRQDGMGRRRSRRARVALVGGTLAAVTAVGALAACGSGGAGSGAERVVGGGRDGGGGATGSSRATSSGAGGSTSRAASSGATGPTEGAGSSETVGATATMSGSSTAKTGGSLASSGSAGSGGASGSGGSLASSGSAGSSATSGSSASAASSGTGSSTSSASGGCAYTDGTVDHDGDGWSPADGDCNDCNRYINPGAYDIPGDGVDEDCDGTVDDEPTGCDSSLTSVATTRGSDGAMAMDLCRTTTPAPPLPTRTWGVISAAYVLPDNSTTPTPLTQDDIGPCTYSEESFQLGFGILGPTFGTMNQTRQGVRMLGLSSGTARQPTDPGYEPVWGFDKCYTSGAPTGFPGETPACGDVTFGEPHDGAALQLVLRIPTNALTMSFDSNFFSYEFPQYVCSPFNDTYVVIMVPSPAGEPAAAHSNIAFDSAGNILSVNTGLLAVCDPTTTAGADGTGPMAGAYVYACPDGAAKLAGTGFGKDSPEAPAEFDVPQEDHASSGWLTTTVSVAALQGQSVTLLFAVWDSSDGILDTTVLVDNVHWTFATGPGIASADAGPVTGFN